MINTYNYLNTQQFNAKIQSLLEQGHIDEYLAEQLYDYRRFFNDNTVEQIWLPEILSVYLPHNNK